MKALCGRDIIHCADLCATINKSQSNGYSFISTYLFHPRYKRNLVDCDAFESRLPATRTDFIIQERGSGTNTQIVGRISPWIDVDSSDAFERRNSELALLQELNWAAHLALPAMIVPLRRPHNPNLARLLMQFLKGARFPYVIWIQIPMKIPQVEQVGACGDSVPSPDRSSDTWLWWSELATLCSLHVDSFAVMLELSEELPEEPMRDRWLSEPVKALLCPTRVFSTNRREFPVLSRSHQDFVQKAFKVCSSQVIITGSCRHAKGDATYQQYMEHLWKNQPASSLYDEQSKGYEDYLQEPLQPLADNLVSSTYEIFEMDPYKYSAYEQAVFRALCDRVPESEKDSRTSVVMVLGAGRGPLVDASLRAAARAERKVRVFAVEKNSNAVITLRNRVLEEWEPNGAKVEVIAGDMRQWQAPEKADIFVSELLGSFGDNELSPDCLDGAQERFLKPDGISIPSRYTSYLAPMQSTKIYNDIVKLRGKSEALQPHYVCLETPYVVRLVNCQVLAPVQPVFTFEHPRDLKTGDNSRHATLTFEITQDAVVHGFAGYFDSTLYEEVKMSTHPERHSPDMFSWFPLVFALLEPVHVRAGDRVTLHMWRCLSETKVWYEWCLTEPVPTQIHNPYGRSYTIGLL